MIPSIKRGIMLLALIGIALCLAGCCSHDWSEATCTAPETCTECGATRGDLGHKWSEATCTSPKTCDECGETEGDVVHAFEIVVCTEPPVCSSCGALGKPTEHTWVDATCDKPKSCKVCNALDGEPMGHSTRRGDCSRCGKYINNLAHKDGFAVVTYSDTAWMQEKDDFLDIYVIGTITKISKMNDVTIVDSEGKQWTVDVGTACDLSSYIRTECEVYGFSSGGISSQHKTPLINMNHDDNRIVFSDGKELYPTNFESTQQFTNKYTGGTSSSGKVWIPTDGGTKYHSKGSCSGMYNPKQVTRDEAEAAGFGRCSKCW